MSTIAPELPETASKPAIPAAPDPAGVERPATSRASASNRTVPWKRILTAAVVLAALGAGSPYGWRYWTWSQVHESTDNAFIDGHIVQVSPRITGHVARVCVADNQFVHAGEVLFELDPADYQAILDEAGGKLTAARADLGAARSVVEQARSQVAAAEAGALQARAEQTRREAELRRADEDLEQYQKAYSSGALSSVEFGKAQTARQTAQATLDAAVKAVAAAEAQTAQARSTLQSRQGQVAVAEAQILTAEAAVERATLNRSYTQVTAAIDGRVTRKSVEPGSYVIPGQPLMALVAPDLWVTANFKETQLSRVKPGQKVEITVDAFPELRLTGRVESIQQGSGARFSLLPPENATGNYVKVVQRVPVKITLDPASDTALLGPGMSVVPIIATDDNSKNK